MKSYFRILFLLIFMGLFPSAAFSQQEAPVPTLPSDEWHDLDSYQIFKQSSEGNTDQFQAKFLNMLVILGLLILFMVIASWALKRMMRNRVSQLNTASVIKVVETRSLSPRSTLYVIEINGKGLLIAETPTSVTHLASVALEQDTYEEQMT